MPRYLLSFDDGGMDHVHDDLVAVGDFPERKAVIGGFSIIDVPTLDDALFWAGRFAAACRCAQEVRVLMDDPEV